MKISHLIEKYIQRCRELKFKEPNLLATTFFEFPFISIHTLVDKIKLSRQSVYDYVKKLEADKIVKVMKIGANKLLYIPEFIEIIK